MEDLFNREQKIFDSAVIHLDEMRNGAEYNQQKHEMLVKEYGRLLKQLRRVTRISDKTTDTLNASKQDLLDKVHYDALTGIYNRRFMEENLKRIIKSISRSGGKLSVLIMDVDFFKQYNDIYGHSMGDVCLKSIAEALSEGLTRADDFVARYGGEEFVAVLPNTDETGAHIIANKLLNSVISCNIPHEKNSAASCVTISIGVTTSEVNHTHTGTDYISCADKALYFSKQNGRNRYTFINFKEGSK